MYTLILISTLTNLSEIRALVYPYKEDIYHLTPDVLYEYLINREFFTGTILKHSFEELAKVENGAYIPEMLNSIIKIKDERKIYRKAANLGNVHYSQGNYEEALKCYFNAFSIFKDLNSPYMQLAIECMNILREKIGEEKFEEVYQELESNNN